MRIGLFGGSFDPPHMGHLQCAMDALYTGEIDLVHLIPSAGHPYKEHEIFFKDRLKMCQMMATGCEDWLYVSRIEEDIRYWLKKGEEDSLYAVEVVRNYHLGNRRDTYRWIIGEDLEDEIHTWHEAEELIQKAPPLIVPRTSDLSSTAIREAYRQGESVPDDWLHPDVKTFLEENILSYWFL